MRCQRCGKVLRLSYYSIGVVTVCLKCSGLPRNRGAGVRGGRLMDHPCQYRDDVLYATGELFDTNDHEYQQDLVRGADGFSFE